MALADGRPRAKTTGFPAVYELLPASIDNSRHTIIFQDPCKSVHYSAVVAQRQRFYSSAKREGTWKNLTAAHLRYLLPGGSRFHLSTAVMLISSFRGANNTV